MINTSPFPRVPEPEIMDNPEQVEAYIESIRLLELISPTHEVLMERAAKVIPYGAHVIDLGCGPGDAIVQLLLRRPDLTAVAVDMSHVMLDAGEQYAIDRGVGRDRLQFAYGNMTTLSSVKDNTFDAVVSTLSLHHLREKSDLHKVSYQIGRVTKPNPAIFIADFAKLPSLKWVNRMLRADEYIQSELYEKDFYNSMVAAWNSDEISGTIRACVSSEIKARTTFLVPFLQIVSTPNIRGVRSVPYKSVLTNERSKRRKKQLSAWLALGRLTQKKV